MHDDHKTHEPPGRTPQQITDAIAQSDVALTINRTGNLLHGLGCSKQRLQLDLFAIGLGSSPCLAAFLPRGGSVGHRVGFDPGHEMVALLGQAVRHLAGGVVGIGDKVVEQSIQRVQKKYPDFPRDEVEEFLLDWIDMGYDPENYSQAQLDEQPHRAMGRRPSPSDKGLKKTEENS